MRTLADIAAALDTDKGPSGCNGTLGHFYGHNYTAAYEAMFAPLRGEPITLLELGVWAGGSMRLWAEAFPQGQIYGIDTDTSRVNLRTLPESVHVWRGDATDAGVLRAIATTTGGFDIVIDDASHRAEDQHASLVALIAHVRSGGWYIIEDVHRAGIQAWLDRWKPLAGTPQLITSLHPEVYAVAYRR